MILPLTPMLKCATKIFKGLTKKSNGLYSDIVTNALKKFSTEVR